jgi:hypothetical protein
MRNLHAGTNEDKKYLHQNWLQVCTGPYNSIRKKQQYCEKFSFIKQINIRTVLQALRDRLGKDVIFDAQWFLSLYFSFLKKKISNLFCITFFQSCEPCILTFIYPLGINPLLVCPYKQDKQAYNLFPDLKQVFNEKGNRIHILPFWGRWRFYYVKC